MPIQEWGHTIVTEPAAHFIYFVWIDYIVSRIGFLRRHRNAQCKSKMFYCSRFRSLKKKCIYETRQMVIFCNFVLSVDDTEILPGSKGTRGGCHRELRDEELQATGLHTSDQEIRRSENDGKLIIIATVFFYDTDCFCCPQNLVTWSIRKSYINYWHRYLQVKC